MRCIFFSFAIVGIVVLPSVARCDDVPGRVIVAKASGDAVVLYDATREVAAIVRDRIDDGAANARLERIALAVLEKALPDVPQARTVTVRLTYARSSDVSPIYGTPTFEGIERYANLKAPLDAAKEDRTKWYVAGNSRLPVWASFTVVGKLPPR